MRRSTLSLFVAALASTQVVLGETRALDGLVTQAGGELGLHDVSVYAYEVARAQVRASHTDLGGRFTFPELPAGLYKLIAFKKGFAPAIAVLSRAADQGLQFVELELAQDSASSASGDDYWSLREAIPTDVLRDIERGLLADATTPLAVLRSQFAGTIAAEAGVEGKSSGQSQVAGASIDLEGRLGRLDVGVDGRFRQLEGPRDLSHSPAGLQELGLEVSREGGSLRYDARRERLDTSQFVNSDGIELAQHRVAWNHEGTSHRSAVAAEYTDRGDLYFASGLAQLAVPFAQRSWRLEGSWERELEHHGGIGTKVRYVEHQLASSTALGSEAIARTLEVSGEGGWHASPALLVEYGLFTRLGDGSLSLAPRGSVVVQLGEDWQARASASGRVLDEYDSVAGWSSPLTSSSWSGGQECLGGDAYCGRLALSHLGTDNASFEIALLSREIAELVRLTFDDTFVDGLLLLPGDEVPELSVTAMRRLGDHVTARWHAAVGEGGGGQLVGQPDSHNRVRYRITALETHFDGTETGLFLTFHELSQGLAVDGGTGDSPASPPLRRVHLRVTQNLDSLLNMASSWALHLGVELSKGRLPFSPADADPETSRRSLTGGLAVRF